MPEHAITMTLNAPSMLVERLSGIAAAAKALSVPANDTAEF